MNFRSKAAAVWAVITVVALLSVPAAKAVEIKEVVSPKGITAWLVEDDTADLISVDFVFRGGSSLDPVDKIGLADLAASTLDEGAGDLDSAAFRRILDDKSITLAFSAGRDAFSGSFRTLNRYRDEAVDLLSMALTRPRFDADAVERIRGQILIGLERDKSSPNARAGNTLAKVVFGDDPYGRPGSGTIEGIKAVTLEDLHGFAARMLTRDRLIIGVVGNITAEELAPLLDTAFGGLPATGDIPDLAPASVEAEGSVVVLDQNLPQSVVMLAQPGIDRLDEDYYAAYVVNFVLGGGGFGSRLTTEIREKRGLAYSTYSYMIDRQRSALIIAGVSTRNDAVAESIALIKEEWKKLRTTGVTEEELRNAKTYLTGSYPLRFTTTSQIAGALTGIQYYGLGIDYIDRRNSYIEAVTLEEANRVAKELYDPEALTVVVVGRPEGVTATRDAPEIGG